MNASRRVERLRPDHPIEEFDCGRDELNRYLLRYAWSNQQAGAAQTYIGLVGNTVVGYHTLAVGHVRREDAPERLTKGLARHPVPIMLLARLAVDRRWQGQGVGKALLRDAMQRTLQAADIAGIRALAVHTKDEGALAFYERFDFIPSPADPMHLFILLITESVIGPCHSMSPTVRVPALRCIHANPHQNRWYCDWKAAEGRDTICADIGIGSAPRSARVVDDLRQIE